MPVLHWEILDLVGYAIGPVIPILAPDLSLERSGGALIPTVPLTH
jgi:hypothetical protein